MITVEKFTLFTIVFEFSLGLASCWLRMTETKIFVVIVRTLWGRMQVRTGGKGRQRETVDMLICWAFLWLDWVSSIISLPLITWHCHGSISTKWRLFLYHSYIPFHSKLFWSRLWNKEYIEYISYYILHISTYNCILEIFLSWNIGDNDHWSLFLLRRGQGKARSKEETNKCSISLQNTLIRLSGYQLYTINMTQTSFSVKALRL